jgi:hypothetical protein
VSSLQRRFPWLLTAGFVLVAGCTLAFHEPWRDEMQAWLLARDSRTPLELIRNLKHEGHPGLWYLLLMPITRVSAAPVGLQLASLAVGAATVWVVAVFSPFTRLQKVLFAFGYFPLYEYTALSRGYGLGVLLLAVACALFRVRERHPLALAAALFLACHTSAHAMLVAAGIGIAFAVDLVFPGARALAGERSRRAAGRRRAVAALLVALVALGAFSAYWQLAPPDVGPLPTLHLDWDPRKLRKLFRLVIRPFVPLTIPGPHYWMTPLIDSAARPPYYWPYHWKVWTGGALLATTTLLLVRRRSAVIAYVAAVAALLALIYDTHPGGIRHHGFLFIAFVSGCWLAEDARRADGTTHLLDRLRSGFLTALLSVHLVAGAIAVDGDLRYEFSAARRAAAFLRAEGLADAPMVAEPDFLAGGLLGFLEKDRAFFPRAKRWGSFVRWDAERLRNPTDAEVVAEVAALASRESGPVVLVVDHPLADDLARSAGLEQIGSFKGDVIEDERFVLYTTRGVARATPAPLDGNR